jgi:hypothetical protein
MPAFCRCRETLGPCYASTIVRRDVSEGYPGENAAADAAKVEDHVAYDRHPFVIQPVCLALARTNSYRGFSSDSSSTTPASFFASAWSTGTAPQMP